MARFADYVAMILVGALWGCTNPLLRHEAVRAEDSINQSYPQEDPSFLSSLLRMTKKFCRIGVLMPYILNQTGSVLFYFLLGNAEISAAVPICNGLALFFSVATTFAAGENVHSPLRTIVGSSLVVIGVATCVMSPRKED